MIADVVWWDLGAADGGTLARLRSDLDDAALRSWSAVPGLRMKLWLADPAGWRWGAVMLWDGSPRPAAELPNNQAAELIGRTPDRRMRFDVAAAVPGGLP